MVENKLAKAHAKLLLAPPPRGFSLRNELIVRFDLWQEGSFSELLFRAEEQLRTRLEDRRARRSCGAARGARARALAREGARSRAIATLTSEMADLTPQDQRRWAVPVP